MEPQCLPWPLSEASACLLPNDSMFRDKIYSIVQPLTMFPYWSCFRSSAQGTGSDQNANFLPGSLQNQPAGLSLLWDLELKARATESHTSSWCTVGKCSPSPSLSALKLVSKFTQRCLHKGFNLPLPLTSAERLSPSQPNCPILIPAQKSLSNCYLGLA